MEKRLTQRWKSGRREHMASQLDQMLTGNVLLNAASLLKALEAVCGFYFYSGSVSAA